MSHKTTHKLHIIKSVLVLFSLNTRKYDGVCYYFKAVCYSLSITRSFKATHRQRDQGLSAVC